MIFHTFMRINSLRMVQSFMLRTGLIQILCHFDYGMGMHLMSQDQQVRYLDGEFRWRNNVLTVTAYDDGTVYTFVRIDLPITT